jgi:TPR repeat protein
MKKQDKELDAICQLAEDYYFGRNGQTANEDEAIRLYKQAAEQGYAEAQFQLGIIYKGQGNAHRDTVEAVKWLRMAAEQGHADAQEELGHSYEFGVGVEIDIKEAEKWYRMAAGEEPEDKTEEAKPAKTAKKPAKTTQKPSTPRPSTLFKKGMEYMDAGDEANAFLCFEQAAERGHAESQYLVGICYRDGIGVQPNKKLMWKWLYEASDNGHDLARIMCWERNERRQKKEKRDQIIIIIACALVIIAAIISGIMYS